MGFQFRSFAAPRFAAAAMVLMLVSACTTLQVGSDYDHAASFQGYKTFTIMQRQHHGSKPRRCIFERRDTSNRCARADDQSEWNSSSV